MKEEESEEKKNVRVSQSVCRGGEQSDALDNQSAEGSGHQSQCSNSISHVGGREAVTRRLEGHSQAPSINVVVVL